MPLWLGILLAGTVAVSIAWALTLRRSERRLIARLATRERRGHFLAEAPDVREILRHAFDAAVDVLPVSRFTLYRVGEDGRVEDVWTLEPRQGEGGPEPRHDAANPHLNTCIDSTLLLYPPSHH